MPVIATPVQQSTGGVGQPSCAVQLAVAPTVTVVEGKPVLAKTQSVQIVQGQLATIPWTMRDVNGVPVDLTACASGSVRLSVREALTIAAGVAPTVIAGSITDATGGLVQATVTADLFTAPGISVAEFGLFDTAGNLIFSNTFYLVVNRGQFGPNLTAGGPPTLAEIRLHMRDSDPSGNLWLGDFEFDMAEIAACVVRPVQQFNEAPPPIDAQFNTATFPWRHNWLNAICGYLYRMAADWYRRVHLPYQGGGLSIDDKNKFQQYDQRGRELLEEWKEWLRWKKVQLNAEAAYQSQGSAYSQIGWY